MAARATERELLLEFIQAHGDLPPENMGLPARLPSQASIERVTRHTEHRITCAGQMFQAVSAAPMSLATRSKLRTYVESNDAHGLLAFLERCVARRSDVGHSIRRAGLHSFESAMPEVRRIFASQIPKDDSKAASLLAFMDHVHAAEDVDDAELWILDDLDEHLEALQDENDPGDEELSYEGLYYDEDADEWLDPEEEALWDKDGDEDYREDDENE